MRYNISKTFISIPVLFQQAFKQHRVLFHRQYVELCFLKACRNRNKCFQNIKSNVVFLSWLSQTAFILHIYILYICILD